MARINGRLIENSGQTLFNVVGPATNPEKGGLFIGALLSTG
jgi:hypothetical protein